MTLDIILYLLVDGLTNGAIYALIAVALVVVFTVTRVIFVQGGEFISYGALTLFALQQNRLPLTLWVAVALCVAVAVRKGVLGRREGMSAGGILRGVAFWLLYPLLLLAAAHASPPGEWPMAVQIALALAIVTPMGPAMYQLAYERLAGASVLVLLITSVAVHFVMDGLSLLAFGPDAARTNPFSEAQIALGDVVTVPVQSVIVGGVAIVLIALLYGFSRHTMLGRALRATASNRKGATLMGIGVEMAGRTSFGIGAFICAMAGILIAPFVTIYYNSGFLISLKAFVGAVVGAMASYPLAALGAVMIGGVESFAAFWSSAYKEVIVFGLMVPVLLWCSLRASHMLDEEEDAAAAPSGKLPAWLEAVARVVGRVPVKVVWGLALVAALTAPLWLSRFYITQLNYVYLYAIVAFGVVLLTGIAGQASFGQAAFVGIGAYTSAMLTLNCDLLASLSTWFGVAGGGVVPGGGCGISPWLSLPVVLLVTGGLAFLVGTITLRMRGHYLPIATIAWAVSIFFVFANTDALGGSSGLTDVPALAWAGKLMPYEAQMYYLILLVALVCGLATSNLLDSRLGRAIRSLKSRAIMAESVGVDTAGLKVKVFLIASLFAGVSGWLYAHMQRFVNPSPFGLNMGIEYVFMTVLGGANHVLGAVLGAATIRALNEVLQDVLGSGLVGLTGNYETLVFGVLIIVMLQRAPDGLIAVFARWLPARAPRPTSAATLPARPVAPPTSGPLLQVREVSKRFGGLLAIDKVSFELGRGEIVALIGPNGAGKSTMFNLITGVLAPTDGQVLLRGQAIGRSHCHRIARMGVARTFQHVKLLSDRTALENAAVGAYQLGHAGLVRTLLRTQRQEEAGLLNEAARQLKRVGLGDAAHMLAGALPLGQQRLLEVARALASEPVLLLLDEPAAGLRHGEKQALAQLLTSLRDEGMSILLVEHDMPFVMGLADRIVVQSFGKKIAEGTPAEVQRNVEVRNAYLGAEA